MFEVAALLLIAISAVYFFFLRKILLINPSTIWLAAQILVCLGSLRHAEESNKIDVLYIWSMVWGIVLFMIGTLLVIGTKKNYLKVTDTWIKRECIVKNEKGFALYINVMIATSIIVCSVYYLAVGRNVFLEGFERLVEGEGVIKNVSSVRLSAYAGEKYFAPGYVNQFKNVLLPILASFIFLRNRIIGRKGIRKQIVSIVLFIVSAFFLLGTGQRAPIFYASVTFLYFSYAAIKERKVWRKYAIIVTISFTLLFSITSFILGRSKVEKINGFSEVVEIMKQLPERFINDNQESGVVGVRYIEKKELQYGKEWLTALEDLLPGKGSKSIASEIHAVMYGSEEGTSPLTVWGTIKYNFGIVGLVIIPLILGVLYQIVHKKMITGEKTLFRVMIYASMSVVLGSWIAETPISMVNRGLLTIMILSLTMNIWTTINRRIAENSERIG